jgi:hypothetical protein
VGGAGEVGLRQVDGTALSRQGWAGVHPLFAAAFVSYASPVATT